MKKNIVLVGMPGTGKTTIANLLSQKGYGKYIDTDDCVKNECQMELKDFAAKNGRDAFLELQRSVITRLEFNKNVVATGGSVVLDRAIMDKFKANSHIIFLNTTVEVLESRLAPDRKLARGAGQSFADIYNERLPFYLECCDKVIDSSGKTEKEVVDEIVKYLAER